MSLFSGKIEGWSVWAFYLSNGSVERRQDPNVLSEAQARLRWPFEKWHPKTCRCGCGGIKVLKVVEER